MGHLITPRTSPRALATALRQRARHPGALLVAIDVALPVPAATLSVEVADPALRERLVRALTSSLAPVREEPAALPVWKISTLRRLRELGLRLAGALVVVRVSERNAGRLGRLVDEAEGWGAAGVQVVCAPEPPASVVAAVFRVLEARRGQGGRRPVVLATTTEPVEVLRRMVAVPRDLTPCVPLPIDGEGEETGRDGPGAG